MQKLYLNFAEKPEATYAEAAGLVNDALVNMNTVPVIGERESVVVRLGLRVLEVVQRRQAGELALTFAGVTAAMEDSHPDQSGRLYTAAFHPQVPTPLEVRLYVRSAAI